MINSTKGDTIVAVVNEKILKMAKIISIFARDTCLMAKIAGKCCKLTAQNGRMNTGY